MNDGDSEEYLLNLDQTYHYNNPTFEFKFATGETFGKFKVDITDSIIQKYTFSLKDNFIPI